MPENAVQLSPTLRNSEFLRQLDRKDRQILHLLQESGRLSRAELARQVNLSAPGLQKRLNKLEGNGCIDRYVALVNREALGLDVLCFAQVTLARHQPQCVAQFCDRVRELPEVLECHHLSGEFDYLLKVVVANHRHLAQFLSVQIAQIPGVDRIRTSIVLDEIKVSTSLPLDSI
ncbi:Lrp/AsnC family transcriptional regulator [Synechococcus sp. PCC 7336]|uniref:Lrp/AsnC family transcriptional regulator n=1 Tax=Synechococcus sp. PCC 7336 TaxID=195250 RepID=UPI000685416F|nr:Lrp/AsnC family transcriptional regulator [Synechococcus sp. PCC 7336]